MKRRRTGKTSVERVESQPRRRRHQPSTLPSPRIFPATPRESQPCLRESPPCLPHLSPSALRALRLCDEILPLFCLSSASSAPARRLLLRSLKDERVSLCEGSPLRGGNPPSSRLKTTSRALFLTLRHSTHLVPSQSCRRSCPPPDSRDSGLVLLGQNARVKPSNRRRSRRARPCRACPPWVGSPLLSHPCQIRPPPRVMRQYEFNPAAPGAGTPESQTFGRSHRVQPQGAEGPDGPLTSPQFKLTHYASPK